MKFYHNYNDLTTIKTNSNIRYNSSSDSVEIYYNNTWNIWKLVGFLYKYLFKAYDACIEETCGWNGYGYYHSGSSTAVLVPTVSLGEQLYAYITATDVNAKTGVLISENAIDLSDYNTLVINYSYEIQTTVSSNYISLHLSQTKATSFNNTTYFKHTGNSDPTGENVIKEINISGLTGLYYIIFALRTSTANKSSSIRINSIYLK